LATLRGDLGVIVLGGGQPAAEFTFPGRAFGSLEPVLNKNT
jgi:hypothetical protein